MRTISSVLLSLTLATSCPNALAVGVSSAQHQAWLPPEVAEGVARQLAGRMKHAGLGPEGDDEKLLAGARQMVTALRAELDSRGEDGIAELAPTFSGFELPKAGQHELDLMARYNICNLALFRQLQDPAFGDDLDAQVTSTLGLTAMTMVIIFLREPFVSEGNDAGRIEAHLTDPRLQPIFDRIQEDFELRASVEQICQPVVTALLERPLLQLGGK